MGLSKKAWLYEVHPINNFLIRLRKTSLFKFYKNVIFRLYVEMGMPDDTALKCPLRNTEMLRLMHRLLNFQ